MKCFKCGSENIDGSTFCVKCGLPFSVSSSVDVSCEVKAVSQGPVSMVDSQMGESVALGSGQLSVLGCLSLIISVILRPISIFQRKADQLSQFKNSIILTLLVSIFSTILALLHTMYRVVRVTSYSWLGKATTTWEWGNLKNINYFKTIGINLLAFLGIIVLIAFVYYVISLVAKKQVNFVRMLGISAIVIIPLILCFYLLAPLFSIIHSMLGMIVIVIGAVYTVVLIYELMNYEMSLDGDIKIYLNFVSLSILVCSVYYVYTKFMMSLLPKDLLSDVLDFFK